MEWLTQESSIFYVAGMAALSIIGWVTWSLAASRNGAHTREVASFFKSEYESVFFNRDMLVALFREDFTGAEVFVKSGSGNVVARLRYPPKPVHNNTIHLEVGGETYSLNVDAIPVTRLSAPLDNGGYVCEYDVGSKDDRKAVFSVNESIVLETDCARHRIIVEGRYPVLQNGQIVGYIYSESNMLGHYAVVLLLKSELPEPVKALFLALEARRFGFAVGGRGWSQ